ncbi:MAG: hypothetical protein LBB39_02130 [Mycoplasmataceae bacterium]|nr:hypothetical protein [Mycoplasmataceae bacterium]
MDDLTRERDNQYFYDLSDIAVKSEVKEDNKNYLYTLFTFKNGYRRHYIEYKTSKAHPSAVILYYKIHHSWEFADDGATLLPIRKSKKVKKNKTID